jgi:zinc protease
MNAFKLGFGFIALLGCATSETFSANTPPFIPNPTPQYFLPSFTASKLENGMTLLVNEDRAIPMMSIAVAFSGGSLEDPAGKSGVAAFMFEMLRYRTQKLPRMILAGAFDDISSFEAYVQPDGVLLQGSALADRAEPAFLLLQEILLNPSFEQGDVEFVREQQLSTVFSLESRVDAIAERSLLRVLYGSEHPLGNFMQGSSDSINAIAPADLISSYDRIVRPERMTVIVSGPIQSQEIARVVQRIFSKWKPKPVVPGNIKNISFPDPNAVADRKFIHIVPRKGLAQTIIRIGRVAVAQPHPDAPLWVLSTYRVAGRASSFLRGLEGVTYGVGGSAELSLRTGHMSIETQVDAHATRKAMDAIFDQIDAVGTSSLDADGMVASGVSMVFGKSNAMLSLRGRTLAIGRNVITGLPWDHIKSYNDFWTDPRLNTFSKADVFVSKGWEIVLVGDPDIVIPQVKDHGFDRVMVVKQ